MNIAQLNHLLGNIDIYLLDQILKGRFTKEMKILDAGCGEGRNTHYFIREGFQIFGVDNNPIAIQMARIYAQTILPEYDTQRFQTGMVEDMIFHRGAFDAVISSAVMHFAKNEEHFVQLWDEMMRVLKPGGIFFLRCCTAMGGIVEESQRTEEGQHLLPDGNTRFLLSESLLDILMHRHNLQHLEDPKTVLVHHKRTMGTFVMKKLK
ncbi:class I SAM-dependent methyltransferase [Litoribacter alkaliphilus]|uniref:Class I SAM-dependent methyltransferase n=1 Tax=Litoribacter ruber TaxID=702568 RepID=A0AAP2CGW1_9BACT|nr:class I SAM-dependent methyltransferase [Litoribacter alkaliphilus]MBS9523349.1 class I SAM-dependent methyltransferase [Litoribacter alkaliphilus]